MLSNQHENLIANRLGTPRPTTQSSHHIPRLLRASIGSANTRKEDEGTNRVTNGSAIGITIYATQLSTIGWSINVTNVSAIIITNCAAKLRTNGWSNNVTNGSAIISAIIVTN